MREDVNELPALFLRQWSAFFDADLVAHGSLGLLVVCIEFLRTLDDLLELGMGDTGDVFDDDRLIHRSGTDHSNALLTQTGAACLARGFFCFFAHLDLDLF